MAAMQVMIVHPGSKHLSAARYTWPISTVGTTPTCCLCAASARRAAARRDPCWQHADRQAYCSILRCTQPHFKLETLHGPAETVCGSPSTLGQCHRRCCQHLLLPPVLALLWADCALLSTCLHVRA